MSETIKQRTQRLLEESLSSCEKDNEQAKNKLLEAHAYISSISSFKRISQDFREAKELYRDKIPEIDSLLAIAGTEVNNHIYRIDSPK